MRSFFKINNNFLEKFIVRCALLLIFFIMLSVCSAVFGIHKIFLTLSPYLIGSIAIYLLLLVILNIKELERDFKQNTLAYAFLAFILLYCIWNASFFFESKIEGGHDQGVFLATAVNLANTGTLFIDNNVALTYPAFWMNENGRILSFFLPGYPAYLSPFYHLFGLQGFAFANAILLFFSISILFYIGRMLRSVSTGIIVAILFAFSYYTVYFSRACYVENLQLFLVWTCVYLFIKGYKHNTYHLIFFSGLPVALLMLVRAEGFLYFIMYGLALIYFIVKKHIRISQRLNVIVFETSILVTIIAFIIYICSYTDNSISSAFSSIVSFFSTPMNTATMPSASYNEQAFIWNYMLQVFNPILIPIMLFFGLVNILIDKPIRKTVFLILLLILPQFIFLIKPSIAFYLPWFMRRFWPVFIPFTLLIFSLFLTNAKVIFEKRSRYVSALTVSVFLIIYLVQSGPILFFSEGKGLYSFEQRVAAEFDSDSLVIFWDRYRYENYGPPLYFLYGINVVFDRSPAFTTELYAMYMKDYDKVYIATSRGPEGSLAHPYFNDMDVEYIKSVEVDNLTYITSQCDVREYVLDPDKFNGYYQFNEKCSDNNPPTQKTDNYLIVLNIYTLSQDARERFISEYYDPLYQDELYSLRGSYGNKSVLGLN